MANTYSNIIKKNSFLKKKDNTLKECYSNVLWCLKILANNGFYEPYSWSRQGLRKFTLIGENKMLYITNILKAFGIKYNIVNDSIRKGKVNEKIVITERKKLIKVHNKLKEYQIL